jgi:hypothetical protein
MSVNNVICHYSPLVSEPDTVLAEGDMVKIGKFITNLIIEWYFGVKIGVKGKSVLPFFFPDLDTSMEIFC